MRLVGLLDCNNFFVSCERMFRPDLVNRPVVVLSGNDGCVVARSNEVKDLGVPMGVPYFQAKDTLVAAGATAFSSNFTLYRDISRRVMTLLNTVADDVEPYSIDEAFFSLEVPDEVVALEQLRTIKQIIEQQLGIPVSVGAAATKTIAKYASAKEKRGSGVCVLRGAAWQAEQPNIPVGAVWGIGRRLAERLGQQGVATVADMLATERTSIATLFGVAGCRLYDELSERVVWPVGAVREDGQKSIMSTRSFRTALTDRAAVADALSYHVHQAAAELRAAQMQCRYLHVLARPSRHGDWVLRGGSAECVLPTPTSDTRVLLQHATQLLDTFYDPEVPYKKAGVVLGWFSDARVSQPDLFGTVATDGPDRLLAVFDQLNQKFGGDVVTIGRRAGAGVWAPARDSLSPRYTTNWADLVPVKA